MRFKLSALVVASALFATAFSTPIAARHVDVIVDAAPPEVRYERVPRHRHGYVWVPGHWYWSGHHYRWRPGYWIEERRGWHYVSPRWEHEHDRWHYYDGRWER